MRRSKALTRLPERVHVCCLRHLCVAFEKVWGAILGAATRRLTSSGSDSGTVNEILTLAATGYGVVAAVAVLLQARQLVARRSSCDVSARFFATYVGGYAVWLLYGAYHQNVPLVIVDAAGLACAGVTLAVILTLRGSLVRPQTWSHCSST